MISNAQLKAIMLCTKGTLAGGSATSPLYAGLRGTGAALTLEDAEMIGDYLERDHRNKIGMKTEFTTLQWGMTEISALLTHIKDNQGCDMQVITESPTLAGGTYQSPYGGIFNFAGADYPGINFEFGRTPKEFTTKITAEALYDYATGKGIIEAASANHPETVLWASTEKAGSNYSKVMRPNLVQVTFGGSPFPLLCPVYEIKDYKLTVKSVGEKTMYGRTIVNMLNTEVEITIHDASIDKIHTLLDAAQNTRFAIESANPDGVTNEAWVFNSLTYKTTVKIDDKLRTQTLLFKGNTYISDVVTSLGQSVHVITFN